MRSAALQTADFLAAVRNEMMNDSDESDDYSEDNYNMNQNNTESEEDLPENEVKIATQDADALIVQEKTMKRQLKFAINAKNRYAKIILKLFVLGAVNLIDSKIFSRINISESKIIFTSNLGQILSFQQLFGPWNS